MDVVWVVMTGSANDDESEDRGSLVEPVAYAEKSTAEVARKKLEEELGVQLWVLELEVDRTHDPLFDRPEKKGEPVVVLG